MPGSTPTSPRDIPLVTPTPRLSIIIVNWNVRDLLRACLCSVARETTATSYELIVVDNASADGSVEMLRADFPDVRLIASPTNLGFARGCELGYREAVGDLVLLLNPDTDVLEGAIDHMVAHFAREPRLGILGGHLRNGDGSFQRATGGAFPTIANLLWNYALLDRLLPDRAAPPPLYLRTPPESTESIDWVSGASLMFRREAVGPMLFDPEIFMFGEDMELCHRVHAAGWGVKVAGDARIIHYHGQSFRQQEAAAVLGSIYKGPRLFFRRHHGPVATLVYDAILLAGYLARWPAFAIAERLRPGRGYGELARFSRRYLLAMLRRR